MDKAEVKTTARVAGAAEPAQAAGNVSVQADGKRAGTVKVDTFAELKSGVKNALAGAQRQMESSRAEGYWDTGRLITAHLLASAVRLPAMIVAGGVCLYPLHPRYPAGP